MYIVATIAVVVLFICYLAYLNFPKGYQLPDLHTIGIETGKKFNEYYQLLFDRKSGHIFEMQTIHFYCIAIYKDRFRSVRQGSEEASFYNKKRSAVRNVFYGAKAKDYAPTRAYAYDTEALCNIWGDKVVAETYDYKVMLPAKAQSAELLAAFDALTADPFPYL